MKACQWGNNQFSKLFVYISILIITSSSPLNSAWFACCCFFILRLIPFKVFHPLFNELIKNTDKKRALSFLKENKNTVNQRAHYICAKCFSEGMKFLTSVLKTANTISNNFHVYGNDTRTLILFRFFVCDPHHKGLDLYLRAAWARSPYLMFMLKGAVNIDPHLLYMYFCSNIYMYM